MYGPNVSSVWVMRIPEKMALRRVSVLLGVLTVANVAVAQTAVDGSPYCASNYSCNPGTNVMCNYPSTFDSTCPSNPQFIPMTDALQTLFLDGHNSRRNTAALGQLGGVFTGKTAARMAQMTWDPELEMMAQKQLLKCSTNHDDCHKTLKFLFPGQNTDTRCDSNRVSTEEAVQSAMTGWWDEYTRITSVNGDNDWNSIQANNPAYDHFTQMAHDTAFKIGCAMITTDGGCYWTTCNYAITNWIFDPVYAVGATRSGCQTQSTQYAGLCGPDENYYGYQSNNVALFNNDQTVPAAVTTFINNGRVLFGSATATTSSTSSSTGNNGGVTVTSAPGQGTSGPSTGNTGSDSGANGGYLLIWPSGHCNGNCNGSSGSVHSSGSSSPSGGNTSSGSSHHKSSNHPRRTKSKSKRRSKNKSNSNTNKKSKPHKKQRKNKKKPCNTNGSGSKKPCKKSRSVRKVKKG